jgi:hypothetical protein
VFAAVAEASLTGDPVAVCDSYQAVRYNPPLLRPADAEKNRSYVHD